MIIRHLPYFVAVAEESNLYLAADRLRVAPSALSRRMKLLESELGKSLFDRSGRTLRLLPAGEVLFAKAQLIVNAAQSAETEITSVCAGYGGRISMGFSEPAARYPWLLSSISRFSRENQTIDLDLIAMSAKAQRSSLSQGILDAGIFYHGSEEDLGATFVDGEHQFTIIRLLEEGILVAMRSDNPLARQDVIEPSALTSSPVIWTGAESGLWTRHRMLSAFRNQGLAPSRRMETITADAAFRLVEAGFGNAIVHTSAKHILTENIILRPVASLSAPLTLSVVWRDQYHSKLLENLAERLKTAAALERSGKD